MHRTDVRFSPAFAHWFGRRLVASTAVSISLAMVAAASANVDLVIVAQALEHVPEPVATLADMRRMLRGRFRLTSLTAIGHNANAGIAGKELNP